MSWLRARKGWSANLALFALALQLITGFGHVHRADGPAFRSGISHVVADRQAAVRPEFSATFSQDADRDIGDAVGGICQICFTLAQTAAASAAATPPLAHPLSFAEAVFVLADCKSTSAFENAFFWSRGPPTS